MGRLQDQCQENIGCNLHLSQGVDEWIALVAPEVPVVAGYKTIEVEQDRLPIPEPSIANRKDNCWNSKTPNEEINSNMPAWVNGATVATDKGNEQDDRVIQ